jgi:hypothetical protein
MSGPRWPKVRVNHSSIGVRIPVISRSLGPAVRRSQGSLALAGLLLVGALGSPASAAAPRSGAAQTAEEVGALPFTFADLGWLSVGCAALIVLLLTIQVLARRPTRKLARTAIQQDPTSP